MSRPPLFQLTVTLLLTLLEAAKSPAKFLLTGPDTSPDITELCPFSTFCTHTSNQSIPDPTLQSCCLPCSCDAGCGSVNKCCPDAPNPTVMSKVYPCRHVTEIMSSYLNNSNWKGKHSHSYTIIDDCPEEAIASIETNENVSRCYIATGVQDLVLVTGSLSSRTYLNKFCAHCNNENEYIEWSMYAEDKKLLETITSFEERDRRILKSGGISLVPPSHEIALGSICSKEPIRTCNLTGAWNYYDKEIERKCNDITMDYYTAGWGLLRSYANVYCFLCNRPKGTTAPSMCSGIYIKTMMDKTVTTSFSALVTSVLPLTAKDTKPECGKGEILDPFRMTCTELLCPIGSFAENGNCVPFVGEPIGLQVGLLMRVQFDAAINTSSSEVNEAILGDLRQLILRHVNRDTIRCGICTSTLLFDPLTENTFIVMPLYSTYQCVVTDLLTGLFRLFTSRTVQATLPRTKLPVTLTNMKDDSSMTTRFDSTSTGKGACIQFMVKFWTEETIHCPSIILNRNESEFLEYERVASQIMSSAVDVGNNTVRVCVSEYMSVFRSTRGTSAMMDTNGLLVAMIVSFLIAL